MLNIDDFDIKIKKYDRDKNEVIVNVTVGEILEIRGYRVRYTETKFSHGSAVWIVAPPAVRGRNKKWFWIVNMKDNELWSALQEKIILQTKLYTNSR